MSGNSGENPVSTVGTTPRERLLWTGALFSFTAIVGIALQARGALLLSFQREFGVSESMLGLVTPIAAFGFVAVVLLFGLTAGRIAAQRWLILGVAGTMVGLLLMGAAPSFFFLLVVIGVRSILRGMVKALDRPLLSHLYPKGRGRVYTLYAMAWAVGATIGPLLVTAVLLVGTWRHTYFVIAVLLVPVLAAVVILDIPDELANEDSFPLSELSELVRQPEITVMSASLVLIGGAESIFFTWLPYYAGQFYSTGMANAALSIYLSAYIPGRYTYSRLADRVANLTLVLISAIFGVVVLGATLTFPGGYSMLAGVFVVGFLVSGLFPLQLAWGTNRQPEYSGPVNAIALTSTQVGFFVFPAFVGLLADVYSIEKAMFVPVVLIIGLIVLTSIGQMTSFPARHRR